MIVIYSRSEALQLRWFDGSVVPGVEFGESDGGKSGDGTLLPVVHSVTSGCGCVVCCCFQCAIDYVFANVGGGRDRASDGCESVRASSFGPVLCGA